MPEKSARHNLSQTIYALRQAFPEAPGRENGAMVPLLLTTRQTIQINPEAAVDVDIHQLDYLLGKNRNHQHSNLENCQTCINTLEQAAILYRGDFLTSFYLEDSSQFEEWAEAVREAYRSKALDTMQTLTDIAVTQNDIEQAQEYADRQLAIDRLKESAHRQLIEILARSGRRAEALRQYRTCLQILEDELGVAPSKQTQELYARIQSDNLKQFKPFKPDKIESAQVTTRSASSNTEHRQETAPAKAALPHHNLPIQPTPFIGRERELADLEKLIADPNVRLITISGPGGMGKTRLSIAAAEQQLTNKDESQVYPFSNGIFFFDLAQLNEATQIPLVIAETLQIQIGGGEGEAMQQLLDYLGDMEMLLVLDNFEHFSDGAQLISKILQSAPGVKVLITSRQRLGLRAEQLYPISGLEFSKLLTLERVSEYSATQLFVSSARRILPDFKTTDSDLRHLANICQMVGGMPLAIELAAGWVEILPLVEIAAEIESSIDILETDLQDIPDRHRSLKNIFRVTWERLDPAEQTLMEKLAVFRGGFTRFAARQVAAPQMGMPAIFRLLGRLVSKSLLQTDPARERYQLHELLRQYVYEYLAQSGKLKDTREAHAAYYLDMLQRSEKDIKHGQSQKTAIDKIETDFANIQTAWNWALQQGNLSAIDQSLDSLYKFFRIRSPSQGNDFFRQAEEQFPLKPSRMENITWRKIFTRRVRMSRIEVKDIQNKLEEILKATHKIGDMAEIGLILECQAYVLVDEDKRRSIQKFEEARSIYQQMDDHLSEYWVLGILSWVYFEAGDVEKRIELIKEQYKMAKENGDRRVTADAHGILGQRAELAGDYGKALAIYQEVLPIFKEYGDWSHTIEYCVRLGEIAFLKGDLTLAKKWITDGQALVKQSPKRTHPWTLTEINSTLGMILNAEEKYGQVLLISHDDVSDYPPFKLSRKLFYSWIAQGDFENAWKHFVLALESSVLYKATGWLVQCLPAAALLAASKNQLERVTEYLSLAYHHPAGATGWLEKFPLIVRLRSRLKEELPDKIYSAAWERGKAMDLEETINTLLQKYQLKG